MFRRLFGKKPVENPIKELNISMSKVDRDIYLIQQWINHLHEKSENIKNSHYEHLELTKRDINNINKWLQYLHTHNLEMHKFVKETSNSIIKLRNNQIELLKRLEKIEQGQLRTLERTIKGQVKDISPIIEDMSQSSIIVEKNKNEKEYENFGGNVNKSEFNGSQIELLNMLYHANRPLSYDEVAKILGKKEKSIRNLIYELREKGIKIRSKPLGIRKKGFFLEKDEKIKISGR